jgi:hypothetical protein
MVAKAAAIRSSNFDYVRDMYEELKGVDVDDSCCDGALGAVKSNSQISITARYLLETARKKKYWTAEAWARALP